MKGREAGWGEPIKLLDCEFCGWAGSELEADRQMGDSEIEESWHLYCPECGMNVGSSQLGLSDEPPEGPWPLTPVASLIKKAWDDFYIANKSRRYSAGWGEWEDAGTIHIAESGQTLCGRQVGDRDHGWTTNKSLGDIDAMIQREEEGFSSDEWKLCSRCVTSCARKTSQAKRSREAPKSKPDDPTDMALEYEVNTGFLDPYRGNISTPEGWSPTRGQPAPRLKKKDKAPVMPADLQYYARRRAAMKRNAEETDRKRNELISLARDLEEGSLADIWYDAADYGDDKTAWRIERTRDAMATAAAELRRMARR